MLGAAHISDPGRAAGPGVGNAEAGDRACFCAKKSCQGATIADNGEGEKSSEFVSQRRVGVLVMPLRPAPAHVV